LIYLHLLEFMILFYYYFNLIIFVIILYRFFFVNLMIIILTTTFLQNHWHLWFYKFIHLLFALLMCHNLCHEKADIPITFHIKLFLMPKYHFYENNWSFYMLMGSYKAEIQHYSIIEVYYHLWNSKNQNLRFLEYDFLLKCY